MKMLCRIFISGILGTVYSGIVIHNNLDRENAILGLIIIMCIVASEYVGGED